MKLKRLAPVALALTVATTTAAGAADIKTEVKYYSSSSVVSQAQQQMLEKLCGRFDFSSCNWHIICPAIKPEVKPDEKPGTSPDETPDVQPDETPDVQPDETPDVPPELPPVTAPEETPDTTPDSKPEQSPGTGSGAVQGDFASQVAALVNQERAKAGLSALKVDAKVQQAAQVRAKEQAQLFSHTRPNGSSCFTALAEAGVSYRGAGENIAYGQSTPQQVMNAWMNSEGHRANILNANFTTIGVGYTMINGTPYWAQMFTY